MEGSDDGFKATGKSGGRQAKGKQPFETPIPVPADQKKKKKQATFMYGGATEGEVQSQPAELASIINQTETEEKKPKKQHKGKKKGKNQEVEEEEETNESQTQVKPQEEEEVKGEEETQPAKSSGLQVVYCKICTLPPEYCSFDKKDYTECKNWLKTAHPDLYSKVYPEVEETKAGEEGKTEENKGQTQKKKKKVGFGTGAPSEVKVYKSKRGAKKVICNIVGLHTYGVNLKDVAKQMSKKFACSATVANDEKYGECIQLQGDISERFVEFVEVDLEKYNIPSNKVSFEDTDKKKKKAAAEAALLAQNDE